MSKFLRAILLVVPILLIQATAVLAQTYPPSVAPTASVAGAGGGVQQAGAGGTAFTGGPGLGTGALLMVLLLVAGLAALFVGWRRSHA
ncbi:MAG TPA: hypothetical protein VLA82_02385 [Actinomycetota bacterium]|nr:hypothetical protein [Actinomycetota bacterium]